jgi:hypothetical protein
LNRPPFETPPGPHGTGALHTSSTRTPVSSVTPRALYYQQAAFKTLNRKQPGRSHQSQAMIVNSSGRDCRYKKCLGFNMPRKRPRSCPTRYQCEECTQEKGIDFWLCNIVKNVNGVKTILDCHAKYQAIAPLTAQEKGVLF